MGARHTTNKTLPSAHSQNVKQRQLIKGKISPQEDGGSNPYDLSWLDSNEVTAPQIDLYTTNINISPSLINFFGRFYKKQKKALKDSEDFLFDENKKSIFAEQLSTLNNISKNTADIWIHAYIDYMILMAWFSFAVEEKEMYAPFAIQQTQRLHISYQSEYKKFCNIITENKGLIHYSPRKMASSHENIDITELLYDELKESIMVYIYENQEIYDSNSKVKSILVEIWESFYDTFIKNEYSFYLFNAKTSGNNTEINKEAIEKAIANIVTENHNFPISFEGVELLRTSLNISINYTGTSGLEILPIINSKNASVSEDVKSIAKTLDESKLPMNFARILSWEQAISIDKAREWIIEYKKFLFLVSLGKQVKSILTEEIKQVWLLHRSFTKNYEKFLVEQTTKGSTNSTISQLDNISGEIGKDANFVELYKNYFGELNIVQKGNYVQNGGYVNFMDSVLKKQEELLNEKLARTLIEA